MMWDFVMRYAINGFFEIVAAWDICMCMYLLTNTALY